MSLPKILLIEDNPAEVELVRRGLDLQREPYELEVLADGEVALRFFDKHRAGEILSSPCVIVLDLHLPRQSGMEVLQAIRREPSLNQIGVVVVTAFITPEEAGRIHRLAAIYLPKPVDLAGYLDLGAAILDVCRGGVLP
jgi:DNA-binding response OmpR family regulator